MRDEVEEWPETRVGVAAVFAAVPVGFVVVEPPQPAAANIDAAIMTGTQYLTAGCLFS